MKIGWKTCFRVAVTVFLLVAAIKLLPWAGGFLLGVLAAAMPLVIGCAIAYLVNILMAMYEKIYFPRTAKIFLIKSRRPVCLLWAYLTLLVVLLLIVALVLPELVSCARLLVEKTVDATKELVSLLESKHILTEELVNHFKTIDWQSKISQVIEMITSGIGNVLNIVIGTVTSIFSGLVTALISVIFSIYLLLGKERIGSQISRLTLHYVKPSIMKKVNRVLPVLNDCFRRYIIGQCVEAVIIGLLCTVGMWIFRFPYATMIGALVAFTALIPVAGAYIGAFVGAFMILTVDPIKALLFLVFIVVLQQIEGNIIYPRVVGTSLGLPGIWVLAAVTVGGGVLGIAGMLLGVPVAATAYRLLREDVEAPDDTPLSVKMPEGEEEEAEEKASPYIPKWLPFTKKEKEKKD